LLSKRALSILLVSVLLIGAVALLFGLLRVQPIVANTRIISQDYSTIQAAIDASSPGDTIMVKPGTYYESIIIYKTVSLVGENPSNTIIEGNGSAQTILVTANGVRIEGFSIRGGIRGIYLDGVNGSTILNNRITNNLVGISLYAYSNNNTIAHNVVSNNTNTGIMLGEGTSERTLNFGCQNNTISGNEIINNHCGISLFQSSGNKIIENRITVNHQNATDDGMYPSEAYDLIFFESSGNQIYHNTFLDSGPYVFDVGADFTIGGQYWHPSNNVWDNGYPSGGNYWSDSMTVDLFGGFNQT
jgi:parallel beta-helix repeat protein